MKEGVRRSSYFREGIGNRERRRTPFFFTNERDGKGDGFFGFIAVTDGGRREGTELTDRAVEEEKKPPIVLFRKKSKSIPISLWPRRKGTEKFDETRWRRFKRGRVFSIYADEKRRPIVEVLVRDAKSG